MPSYDFLCDTCGARSEEFGSPRTVPLERPCACGGTSKRQIGPGAGVIFKGPGFHATDYAKPRPVEKEDGK